MTTSTGRGSASAHARSKDGPPAPQASLTGLCGPPGTALAEWLDRPVQRPGSFPVAVRPLDRIVITTVDASQSERPQGPAAAEASAVRLRRAGVALKWGRPRLLPSAAALLTLCFDRGKDSVRVIREEPELLTEMQIGCWPEAGWPTRVVRRLLAPIASLWMLRSAASRLPARLLGLFSDVAFWAGVRRTATQQEWRQLTRSYTVLLYHRISDDRKANQELLEVLPHQFRRQMRILKVLRYHFLSPEELATLHHEPGQAPPRRSVVVTADDGYLDCTEPLREARVEAQLFVPTRHVGQLAPKAWYDDHPAAGWLVDNEPLAGWDQLRSIETAGVHIGSHGHEHVSLAECPAAEVLEQLEESRRTLERNLRHPTATMAYPHGSYSCATRDASRDAAFQLAFTTVWGRNGVGTDPWCLRRVPIFRRDGLLRLMWKVVTGAPPPALKVRRSRRTSARPS